MVGSRAFRGRVLFVAVAMLVLIGMAACSPQTAGKAKEVSMGADAEGSRIEVNKGDVIVVSLEATPGTGYSWVLIEPEEKVVEQVGEPEFLTKSDLVGASGLQVMRFKTLKAGEYTFKLGYLRPWEKGVEPVETFSVQLVVR